MVTLTDYAIPGLLHYVRKKVRWGPEGATFRTKSFHFTRVIHFNWLAKSNWCGPGLLVVNIIGNYCCTLVLLYAKMLKKKKMKKYKVLAHFYYWRHFNCGWERLPAFPPPATPMIVTSMLFAILRFCVQFLLFALVGMSKRHYWFYFVWSWQICDIIGKSKNSVK